MNSGGDCKYDCIETAKQLIIRGVKIGEGLRERLKSGSVSDDRMYKYEKRWVERLRKLDERHTSRNKLTELEAAKILCKIGKFFEADTPPVCPDYKKKILSCMEFNNNETQKCREEVEQFSNCVDDALISVSRQCASEFIITKKPSYTEKFQKSVGRLF